VPRSGFAGFRFPPDVIMLAVRWYLRYGLSYRDVEELLAERGIEVDHVSVYRWVQRFTPLLIDAARPCRHASGDRWFVDETYVKRHCCIERSAHPNSSCRAPRSGLTGFQMFSLYRFSEVSERSRLSLRCTARVPFASMQQCRANGG
jgi:hypothetical protein